MTTTLRTTVLRAGLLAIVVVAAVSMAAVDVAWACDPDPSDWEAGLAACEQWQRELDRERWVRWLVFVLPGLALGSFLPFVVRRRRR